MNRRIIMALISAVALVGVLGLSGCSSPTSSSPASTSVSKTTLTSAITAATTLNTATTVGTSVGQVSQTAKDAYTAAIAAAQAVADNTAATQTEVDTAVTALATATSAFNNAIVQAAPSYFYSTAGVTDIVSTITNWGSGTTIVNPDTSDATYSPSIKLTSGTGWGVTACAIAFTALNPGKLSEFVTLKFKVKSTDYTSIVVKIPPTEKTYTLASGTALANGWVQMSVPLSDFAPSTLTAVEFGILNNTNTTAGSMSITDVGVSGTGVVDTSALAAAITTATTLNSAHSVGTANGDVTQAVKDAFTAAIATAQAVITSSPTAQSQVTTGMTDLAAATVTFNAAILVISPTTVPSVPTLLAANVVNLYTSSSTYVNPTFSAWAESWSNSGLYDDTTSVSGSTLKKAVFTAVDGFSGSTLAATVDITGKKTLHLSYYTLDGTALSVKIVDFGGATYTTPTETIVPAATITKGSWQDLELDFSAQATATNIGQLLILANNATGTYWFDNIYFH